MTVFADEFEEFFDSLGLRDVLLYTLLRLVEGDLPTTCSHIAVVSIGHLTRAIDDTAHNADLQTHEVFRGSFDLGDGLLEVIERTATTRAGDILRLGELDAGCLKDGISKFL